MKIRECVPPDAEAVLVLWRLADATISVTDNVEDIRKAAVATSTHFLVAEADDKIIGTIIGGFDGWRGNIYRLAVHPDYRRRESRGGSSRKSAGVSPTKVSSALQLWSRRTIHRRWPFGTPSVINLTGAWRDLCSASHVGHRWPRE
jgi:hypothetical protein